LRDTGQSGSVFLPKIVQLGEKRLISARHYDKGQAICRNKCQT
jgi:hypothetical protein